MYVDMMKIKPEKAERNCSNKWRDVVKSNKTRLLVRYERIKIRRG